MIHTTSDHVKTQIAIEMKYSKKHVRDFVKEDLMGTPEIVDKFGICLKFIEEWKAKDFYESKNVRLSKVTMEQVQEVMVDVMALLSQESRIQALTGIIGRCHSALELPYIDAIKTVGEICAHMCEADLVDIYPSHVSPVKIQEQPVVAIAPKYGLDEDTALRLKQSMHLPPMVCKPRTLVNNHMSGYLCGGKPVILGRLNQSNENVSLDVMNSLNNVPFSLDIEFLRTVQDVLKPSKKNKKKEITEEQRKQWELFTEQSNHVYLEMIKHGNKFYMNHHVDLNGRVYSEGYHINYQGKAFKKAMVNFYEGENLYVEPEYKEMFG